ncbi:MAG: S1/P1 nuclease [Wenzhouxiangellaceae bacterium]
MDRFPGGEPVLQPGLSCGAGTGAIATGKPGPCTGIINPPHDHTDHPMRSLILIVVLGLHLPTAAWAWGQTGHRVAGDIAAHYLSPEAKVAVERILGTETPARASTWPDFMRADPSEFWQRTASPWHYVTVPPGKTYSEVGAPPQGDAYTALERFAATLRDRRASRDDQALALRFAIHIIADLHQPLHVGNGSDRGGNQFTVTFFGENTNLHRVWDQHLIERMELSYTELATWLLADIDDRRFEAWNNPDPLVWIAESAEIRNRIYPTDRDLSWDYGFRWNAMVEQRLAQAGVRTAAWLNHVFARP